MISDNEKYQNILTQIHELNRQNLLNENQKTEEVSKKIDNLEESSSNINKNIGYIQKILIVSIILMLINIFLSIFLISNINSHEKKEVLVNEKPIEENEIEKDDILPEKNEGIENISEEDVFSFDKEYVEKFKDESFEKVNPIIRKGTVYTCDGDSKEYQIPYTVEIKGRLYSNRFTFTLHENNQTRNCTIQKENM